MTKISLPVHLRNPREELLKKVTKIKIVEETITLDQYIDKYVVKAGNEYMSKTTFNDLLNKVDKVLKNQEIIIDLLFREKKISPEQYTPRFLYKENYETGKYIKVGILAEDDVIELYPPKMSFINNPTLYSTTWYIEPKGYEGTEQYLGISREDLKNTPQEIIVKRFGQVDKVTGYLTEDGRAIYYDQYL